VSVNKYIYLYIIIYVHIIIYIYIFKLWNICIYIYISQCHETQTISSPHSLYLEAFPPHPSASPAARRSGSDPPPGQALEPRWVGVGCFLGHFLVGFLMVSVDKNDG
jgi:hypothetical protein